MFPTCVFTDWKHVPPSMPATKHPQTAVAGIAPSQPRRPPSGHSSPHGTDTSSRFSGWSTAFQAVRTRVGNPCYRSEGGRDLVAREKIAPSIYRRETGQKRDLQTPHFRRPAGCRSLLPAGRGVAGDKKSRNISNFVVSGFSPKYKLSQAFTEKCSRCFSLRDRFSSMDCGGFDAALACVVATGPARD